MRPNRTGAQLTAFVFLVFVIVGVVLMLLGVSLDDVDRWLTAHAGWFDAVGSVLFRMVCGLVLLTNVTLVYRSLRFKFFGRKDEPAKDDQLKAISERKPEPGTPEDSRFGWGMILVMIVIGYFAWVGTFYVY